MPVDPAPIAARQEKPGDLRHPVADRDQMHPTVSAATQTNAGDLVKRHVDHAAHLQPVVVRLTVFRHGREPVQTSSRTYNHCLTIFSRFVPNSFRKMAMPALGGRPTPRLRTATRPECTDMIRIRDRVAAHAEALAPRPVDAFVPICTIGASRSHM